GGVSACREAAITPRGRAVAGGVLGRQRAVQVGAAPGLRFGEHGGGRPARRESHAGQPSLVKEVEGDVLPTLVGGEIDRHSVHHFLRRRLRRYAPYSLSPAPGLK